MKARIVIDASTLKSCVRAVKGLVGEARVKIDDSGIKAIEMDAANVAMVVMNIPRSACIEWNIDTDGEQVQLATKKEPEKIEAAEPNVEDDGEDDVVEVAEEEEEEDDDDDFYEEEEEEPIDVIEFGLNMLDLWKVLNRASEKDVITLETEANKFSVRIGTNKKFWLPMLAIEDDKPQKVPELKFDVEVKLPTINLKEAIEDAEFIGESIRLSTDKGLLVCHSESDLQKVVLEVKPTTIHIIEGKEKSTSKYSIEYLKKMIDNKIGKDAVIEFGNDYPMRIRYSDPKYSIIYILAPRVDNSN